MKHNLIYIFYLLPGEATMDVVRNNSNQLTVVCGDLESDCFMSYESNNWISYMNFQPNTTTSVFLDEIKFSSVNYNIEISAYINSTHIVWNTLHYSGT